MLRPMPEPIPTPSECQCSGHPLAYDGCICGRAERALRAGGPFTAEQRDWCASEIGAVEGHMRPDLSTISDRDLGMQVLYAWQDYCRDKGLI